MSCTVEYHTDISLFNIRYTKNTIACLVYINKHLLAENKLMAKNLKIITGISLLLIINVVTEIGTPAISFRDIQRTQFAT